MRSPLKIYLIKRLINIVNGVASPSQLERIRPLKLLPITSDGGALIFVPWMGENLYGRKPSLADANEL